MLEKRRKMKKRRKIEILGEWKRIERGERGRFNVKMRENVDKRKMERKI